MPDAHLGRPANLDLNKLEGDVRWWYTHSSSPTFSPRVARMIGQSSRS
jgi:hypothetical protein